MATINQQGTKTVPLQALRDSVDTLQPSELEDIAEQAHAILAEQLIDEAAAGNIKIYSQSDIDALALKYSKNES